VRRLLADLGEDIARDAGPVRFEAPRVDAVVADEGVGLAEDLPLVGGVGDGLRVADDPGIENDFPPNFGACAETYALVDGAVGEGQNRFPDDELLRFILAQYSTGLWQSSRAMET
jgi:hypothetical protein